MAQEATTETAGKLVIRNIGLLLSGALERPILDADALVAIDGNGVVVGFAFLHAYHPAPCLKQTAEITSFLHPDHTHQGLGGQMLETLVEQATAMGVNNIVASISSKNQPSLQFHAKHGFNECGRIVGAGRKFDELFDVVYMQRRIV